MNSTTSVEMILKDQRDRYKRRVDELEVGHYYQRYSKLNVQ